jgi:hypothetical protein
MPKAHDFCSHIRWTGNLGQGNATVLSDKLDDFVVDPYFW